jgi:hypothetical protein
MESAGELIHYIFNLTEAQKTIRAFAFSAREQRWQLRLQSL